MAASDILCSAKQRYHTVALCKRYFLSKLDIVKCKRYVLTKSVGFSDRSSYGCPVQKIFSLEINIIKCKRYVLSKSVGFSDMSSNGRLLQKIFSLKANLLPVTDRCKDNVNIVFSDDCIQNCT